MTIRFTSVVDSLPDTIPFVGPETLERNTGIAFTARLGANESAFGISPRAHRAIVESLSDNGCSWYGDPENHKLRSLLSRKHGVSVDNICVDAGIDSLLGLTIRMFVDQHESIVTSIGAYPTVNYHAHGYGAQLNCVPYRDHHEDPVALVEAAHEQHARLIYLANPDNPMGTCLQPEAINDMLEALPEDCLLMLDEAYIEFMDDKPALTLNTLDNRLIRFRTFSKAYGLAGLRIGYVLANPHIIAGYNRIRNHFGVNRIAQRAAEASLEDHEFIAHVCGCVRQGRQRIYDMADEFSLEYLPSATNFVAVDIGDEKHAAALMTRLAERGVFIRKPNMPPQNRFIRIGVGTEEQHEFLRNVLSKLL